MAAFNTYNSGAEALVEGINAGTDTWRVILSNTAPDVTDVAQADAAELTTSGGYTVNGNTCAITSSTNTAGVYKLILADPAVWTATGGGFTARYAILWNQTADKLIGWWDHGASNVYSVGGVDTLTVTLDGSAGVFTVT